MRNNKYIEFYETKSYPLKKVEFVKGVKYKVCSETESSYILQHNIEIDKSLEDVAYYIGEIVNQCQ